MAQSVCHDQFTSQFLVQSIRTILLKYFSAKNKKHLSAHWSSPAKVALELLILRLE